MAHAVDLIQSVEQLTEDRPEIMPGDTVNVHVRIVEGNRERIQVFQGVVIAIKGSGINKLFTVRRIAAHGVGVERTFLFHSPRIEKVEVLRNADVNRAKLYYLRGRSGKSARLKERRIS
jgi:large subunit ribosomal protein L19